MIPTVGMFVIWEYEGMNYILNFTTGCYCMNDKNEKLGRNFWVNLVK